ncbi:MULTISPECIES: hypothetical protein [Nocardia]|uniref:WXG100 family type VII secretion target n=1 Tax=Nocardia aurea TaxID=2144174 RepID=A0ABV3FPZ5_9NOCA|nr:MULTISPECIES: hypothetical protein [Nocardia]
MGNSEVEVYTEKLRRSGDANGEAHEVLAAVADDARRATAAGSVAWGPDKFGAKFAEGPKGFLAQLSNVLGGTENMSGSFHEIAGGQYGAATALERNEQASTDNFT